MLQSSFVKSLPLVVLTEVFHVGTFDVVDKGEQGASLEGNGLSVSLHPDEWIGIARLGGRPTWKLQAGEGRGQFLDSHAMTDDLNLLITKWGLAEGLVVSEDRWKASWVDDESESDEPARSWSLYKTRLEAILESEDMEDALVESVSVHCATSKMRDRCGFDPGDMNAVDILKTFFAEDHGLDGVWWEDTLDPCALSAPRGVINRQSLDSWSKECVAEAKPATRGFRP